MEYFQFIVSPDQIQLTGNTHGWFFQGMQIWVSKDAPQELIQKILGVKHFGAIPETMVG